MSWKASAHVLDLAREHEWLTVTHLAILYALAARHHQDDHCAWGQLPRIMEDTHASESTVSHVLADLEQRGIVTVWEGQLPRRKGDPDDKRRTRSLFYCFPGLDPDDGPVYEGVVRHIRRGGAATHRQNSVADSATQFDRSEEADELQQAELGVANHEEFSCSDEPQTELQNGDATTGRPVRPDRSGLTPDPEPAPPIVPPASGWGGFGESAAIAVERSNGAARPALAERPPPSSVPPDVPLKRTCPDCHQLVGAITAKGHTPGCWRFGLASSHEWFSKARADIEAELEQAGLEGDTHAQG